MEILRFAHQFFHFHRLSWDEFWEGKPPTWDGIEKVFRNPIFPRRRLRVGEIRTLSHAREIYARLRDRDEQLGVRCIGETDPDYPESLRTYLPPERRPPLLYLRGGEIPAESSLVAMVGTRNPSQFGIESCVSFAAFFSALKIRIISGLAKGIDATAHQENIFVGTMAVLGSSVVDPYPAEHSALADEIVRRGGTLISPFPAAQVPLPHNFPQRNEIIAALSCGTIVIEGNERSGAAVTARHALAMDKTVVVLTQDFRSGFGRGAIRLQQEGAVLVTREEEALHALFARLGGYIGDLSLHPGKQRQRSFTFADFHAGTGKDLAGSLAELQAALLSGNITRKGVDQYEFRRP
jgi:DNA protecting protein DprA